MPVLQITYLAIIAMVCLAGVRLARLRRGWTPMPEGSGRLLLLTAFVFVPPIVLGFLAHPTSSPNLSWAMYVPVYVGILGALAIAMSTVAGVIGKVGHGPASRVVRLALAGTDLEVHEMPSNPPLTSRLAEITAIVRQANDVFPRGPEFPKQPERPGFRGSFDALEGATRTLEGQIKADNELGLGAATSAVDLAEDARSRLTMLRRMAWSQGQAWAQT